MSKDTTNEKTVIIKDNSIFNPTIFPKMTYSQAIKFLEKSKLREVELTFQSSEESTITSKSDAIELLKALND